MSGAYEPIGLADKAVDAPGSAPGTPAGAATPNGAPTPVSPGLAPLGDENSNLDSKKPDRSSNVTSKSKSCSVETTASKSKEKVSSIQTSEQKSNSSVIFQSKSSSAEKADAKKEKKEKKEALKKIDGGPGFFQRMNKIAYVPGAVAVFFGLTTLILALVML